MINNDLTNNCPQELELWIDNDRYLAEEWRKTIRTGNMAYIKDAFDEVGFKYRKDQWEHLVDAFEAELEENERALEERNVCRDMHGYVVEGA
jgi:translation initiation factor 2 alpha subunit (eIF-2alpha)